MLEGMPCWGWFCMHLNCFIVLHIWDLGSTLIHIFPFPSSALFSILFVVSFFPLEELLHSIPTHAFSSSSCGENMWFILHLSLVDVQFSDGYLDLIIMRDCPRLPLLGLMSQLNNGNHIKSPHVMYFKVSSGYYLWPHWVFLMVQIYKIYHNLLDCRTPCYQVFLV